MSHQFDNKISANQSRHTIGNVTITFPDFNTRQKNTVNRFSRVSVQRLNTISQADPKYYDAYLLVDREKAAQTGRWILNAIAAKESHPQTKKVDKNDWYIDPKQSSKKKHSFQSRKSSKVEPIEHLSSQFVNTQIQNNKNRNMNRLPQELILSPTTIDDGQMTPMSRFSTAMSIDDIRTVDTSIDLSQTKSRDYSIDEFQDGEERPCISKRIMIVLSVIALIIIIGVIIAVFVTIFVGRNG